MTSRYRAVMERIEGDHHSPVVIDITRQTGDQIICFAVSMYLAERIALALNREEERGLTNGG